MTGSDRRESRRAPGWVLDEAGSAGRENLDIEHVARYDQKEDAHGPEEVELLKRLGLNDESVVVELGAGTGQFTLAVAPHCARVFGVDVSPLMLDRLRSKVAAQGLTNVSVVEAGFLTYTHQGPSPDFLYSRYALHHLPDFWKAVALQRAHDVLRTGGTFRLWDVVYNFGPADAEERLERWCASGSSGVEDEWSRAEYEEHVRDEHSTFSWLLESMIERAGFRVEDVEYSEDSMFAKYVLRKV